MSELADRGFVHVLCNDCGNPEVWLRCESCDKADHFKLTEGTVDCDCGATYSHATCLCNALVPPTGKLEFVPFDKGPMGLADLEVAWGRVAALAGVAIAAVIGVFWFFMQ